ncbi:MAG: hypothetical protein ACLS37_12965 [Alistipes sp.]
MAGRGYVSLGAFGGYIVAGLTTASMPRPTDTNLPSGGNSFDTSSEPGVVWVIQDENGDGLPNDTAGTLRGSEYDDPAAVHGYAVTYYRPHRPARGSLDGRPGRPGSGRTQRIPSAGLLLPRGWPPTALYVPRTLLENRAEFGYSDRYGDFIWMLPAREWGYADNYSDEGRDGTWNLFRISDAVPFRRQPGRSDLY